MDSIAPLALVTVLLVGCGGGELGGEPASGAPNDTGVVAVEDGATPDDTSPIDAPSAEAGPTTVGVFVAQGHAGRTVLSCDDGRTWIKNRSDDDSIRCFEGNDCDHSAGAGRGVTVGEGFVVATFGWGEPGSVRRSRDGVTWERTLEGTTFGGMVFDPTHTAFVATSGSPQVSADLAKTWTKAAAPSVSVWNVRGASFGAGNVLMLFEDSGKSELALSNDAGKSWWKPTTWPSTCGKSIPVSGGIAFGNDTLLVVGGDGTACRSTDGGKTFHDASMGGTVTSSTLFTGTEFVAWGRTDENVMYRSADGATWTTTKTAPSIGAVARSDDGTFAASNDGWMVWYEKQAFYRSKDGITWETLPKSSFTGSHPIRNMAYGRLDPSACE